MADSGEAKAMPAATTRIELTGDEALVLIDWLSRFNETGRAGFEDQAEQRALWNLEAALEKSLVEIFDPRYVELVDDARERLRDPEE
jgi:hypothetical protein